MSLLDSAPEYFSTSFHELQAPLVPLPVHVELLEDIYTVGIQPVERWRSFINIENWNPYVFHDDLLKKRGKRKQKGFERREPLVPLRVYLLCRTR
jgi:hypothetical protein